MRALIADDHELFRSGLRQLLVDVLDASEVREAATFDHAIEVLTNEGAGDLILVDLRMPGMSGAEALAALRDGFPDSKLAVVSAWEERAEIIAALSAGVHGYIPKSLSSSEIAAAIRSILGGQIFVPAALGRREPGAYQAAQAAPAVGGDKLTLPPARGADRVAEGASEQGDRALARHRRRHREDPSRRDLPGVGRANAR